MGRSSRQLLDDFDRLVVLALRDPVRARVFYAITVPEDMVLFAQVDGIVLKVQEFVQLLSTDSGRYWFFGSKTKDPIAHLQKVFSV